MVKVDRINPPPIPIKTKGEKHPIKTKVKKEALFLYWVLKLLKENFKFGQTKTEI